MYKLLIKRLLFLFDPETAHKIVSVLLKILFGIPFIPQIFRLFFSVNDKRLKTKVFGIEFDNPVGIAAGFDKQATLYNEMFCLGFSHIEIGTVTPKPQFGNEKPRLFRLPQDNALINRMGFNNIGLEKIKYNLSKQKHKLIIAGNIGKNTTTKNKDAINDYITCFEGLFDYVDYFTINVSCPNIKNLSELQNKDSLSVIVREIQRINNTKPKPKPILIKISPDLTTKQLDDMIELVIETNLDGIVATNTSTSRIGLKTNEKTVDKIGNGGLSGKPLTDRSTEIIRYIAQKSGKSFPIIGIGGIHSPKDAIDKLKAGATLVQVYTGFIYEGPCLAKRINKAILRNLSKK
ncbi:MAG: quinone-dependent dihydroorotate dehydrogenase [Bacteroidota bacterium]|nr:quinone-dependent dihydroorotate dehydrogenase [Bacteroidota bacterium]